MIEVFIVIRNWLQCAIGYIPFLITVFRIRRPLAAFIIPRYCFAWQRNQSNLLLKALIVFCADEKNKYYVIEVVV